MLNLNLASSCTPNLKLTKGSGKEMQLLLCFKM